jgi:hypothetical protein
VCPLYDGGVRYLLVALTDERVLDDRNDRPGPVELSHHPLDRGGWHARLERYIHLLDRSVFVSNQLSTERCQGLREPWGFIFPDRILRTMTRDVSPEQIRAWIDDDLVGSVDQMPDEAAEFNYMIDMSNIVIHVLRREPGGAVLVGQQIEYDDEIRSRIRSMDESDRNDLVARVRETLTAVPVIYGFHDEHDNNVRFADVHRVLLEHRIYPDGLSQQSLMSGLVDVWKALRYLDDIVTLIGSVERR